MDNHLDRKLDLIANMLRCIYFDIGRDKEKDIIRTFNEYTDIMTELNKRG